MEPGAYIPASSTSASVCGPTQEIVPVELLTIAVPSLSARVKVLLYVTVTYTIFSAKLVVCEDVRPVPVAVTRKMISSEDKP